MDFVSISVSKPRQSDQSTTEIEAKAILEHQYALHVDAMYSFYYADFCYSLETSLVKATKTFWYGPRNILKDFVFIVRHVRLGYM